MSLSDTQLFGGPGLAEENAKMVLRKLRAGGLPNTPAVPPSGWEAMVEEWAAALSRFDVDVLDKAGTQWIRTGVNFPSLPAFINWTSGRERERREEEKATRGSQPCPECEDVRYVLVQHGQRFLDPRDNVEKISTGHFAIPCGTCPEMENRHRLWVDGHFDLDHEVCGRCKEYRLPQAGKRG